MVAMHGKTLHYLGAAYSTLLSSLQPYLQTIASGACGVRWMKAIGHRSKLPLSLGWRSVLTLLGRSVALAERLCASRHSASPGEPSPRPHLQKYNSKGVSSTRGRSLAGGQYYYAL
jgi:hypothetical protein